MTIRSGGEFAMHASNGTAGVRGPASALVLAILLVASCASEQATPAAASFAPVAVPADTPPAVVLDWMHGAPVGVDPSFSDGRTNDVALDSAGQLQVMLFGQYTCPLFPDSVLVTATDTVTITSKRVLVYDSSTPDGKSPYCSADVSATTSTIAVPEGLDVGHPFHVVVDGTDHLLGPPKP